MRAKKETEAGLTKGQHAPSSKEEQEGPGAVVWTVGAGGKGGQEAAGPRVYTPGAPQGVFRF